MEIQGSLKDIDGELGRSVRFRVDSSQTLLLPKEMNLVMYGVLPDYFTPEKTPQKACILGDFENGLLCGGVGSGRLAGVFSAPDGSDPLWVIFQEGSSPAKMMELLAPLRPDGGKFFGIPSEAAGFSGVGTLAGELQTLAPYKYVVVVSRMDGKWLFSRHKDRRTWETQGGHIEWGETPLQAARRELYEESGAVDFDVAPVCDYFVWDEEGSSAGVVYLAEIRKADALPENSEMAETALFSELPSPDNLTYPSITPAIFQRCAQSLNRARD